MPSSSLSPRRTGLAVNRPIQDKRLRALIGEFRERLHLPDPAPLYAVLGALGGNLLPGNAVWLMLVGGPAAGGTELLISAKRLPWVHCHDDLSGEAALLSASPKREVVAGATGGILRKMGAFGVLVMADFTSVLNLPREPLNKLLAAFRRIYDGEWSRDVGVDGGKHITWGPGKMGFLTKCTPMIDRHHAVNADMGERFIQYRYPSVEGFTESQMALGRRESPEEMREALAEAVEGFFEGLGEEGEGTGELSTKETERLIALAMLGSRARSAVYRNPFTREVEDMAQHEFPARMSQALRQLYRGMKLVGVAGEEVWRVIGKVAIDSVPAARRAMLLALANQEREVGGRRDGGRVERGLGIAELELVGGGCSTQTLRRALEDLEIHHVVAKGMGKGKADRWVMSDWTREQWRVAFPEGFEGVLGDKFGVRV